MILEKTLLLESCWFFSQIRTWSKSCMKVLWQLSDNFDKIAIQVSTETFWTKNVLLLIKTIFFSFTDSHWCIFKHPKKTILSVLSIRHSTYPEERLDEISFPQRIRIVLHFRTLNEKSPQLLPENFVTFVKIVLKWPGCVFRLIYYFQNCAIFLAFLSFDWFSFIFGWFFFSRFCKTALYVSEDLFEEKILVLDSFSIFQLFRDLSENFSLLWRQLCRSIVKSALFSRAKQNDRDIVLKKRIKP